MIFPVVWLLATSEAIHIYLTGRSLNLIECEADSESKRLLETNKKGQLAISRKLALVEAAGIEPASRNISMQASTYVVEQLSLTT